MSETLFTPGPWSVPRNQTYRTFIPIYGPQGEAIASTDTDGDLKHPAITANAYLIAAAPDLYEACKYALREQYGQTALDEDLVGILEAAIAKAEWR